MHNRVRFRLICRGLHVALLDAGLWDLGRGSRGRLFDVVLMLLLFTFAYNIRVGLYPPLCMLHMQLALRRSMLSTRRRNVRRLALVRRAGVRLCAVLRMWLIPPFGAGLPACGASCWSGEGKEHSFRTEGSLEQWSTAWYPQVQYVFKIC